MSSLTLTIAPARMKPGHHAAKAPLKVTLPGTSSTADLLGEIAAKKKVIGLQFRNAGRCVNASSAE